MAPPFRGDHYGKASIPFADSTCASSLAPICSKRSTIALAPRSLKNNPKNYHVDLAFSSARAHILDSKSLTAESSVVQACGDFPLQIHPSMSRHVLCLSGALYTTLEHVSENVREDLELGGRLKRLLELIMECDLPIGEDIVEVTWRTLIANGWQGNGVQGPRNVAETEQGFRSVLLGHLVKLCRLAAKTIQLCSLRPWRRWKKFASRSKMPHLVPTLEDAGLTFTDNAEDMKEVDKRVKALFNSAIESQKRMRIIKWNKLLMRLSNARLGLWPAIARPGDGVWILPGSRVPFLLRKVEPGRLQYIGDVYVQSIMNGEAVPSGNLKFERINLKGFPREVNSFHKWLTR